LADMKGAFIETSYIEAPLPSCYVRPRDHIINALLPLISDGIPNHIFFVRAVLSTIIFQDLIECPAYKMSELL